MAKLALGYPIAQCISQLKWVWFSTYRQLNDMSVFDQVSRGVSRSYRLLLTTKLRSFAIVGSFLMIYEIAIGPFSQQLIAYRAVRSQGLISSHAAAPIVQYWQDVAMGSTGGMLITDESMTNPFIR